MSILSASILAADFAALGKQCQMVLDAGADWLHFDVMDGHFVPNISFGAPVLRALHKALPGAFYDVHLMISDPAAYAPDFAAAGAHNITFHLEAVPGCEEQTIAAIRALGCEVGVSIRPGTPVEALFPYLDALDMILVMSVEPGFGGQKFMRNTPDRIAALRAECLRRSLTPHIQVDGGINAATATRCLRAGADSLVMGSALFGAADPAGVVRTIKALR